MPDDDDSIPNLGDSRRVFLQTATQWVTAGVMTSRSLAAKAASSVVLPFANGERPMAVYPQKRPLIVQTARPPQLETPFSYFREGVITPNEAFFVRYHLANIPTTIDLATFRLVIQGEVKEPLSLSVADLKAKFPATEIVAVNQCSGNSRGFSEPRVAGGQLAHGAMGNARWRGVRLKAILNRAGLRPGAKLVTFRGLDAPVLPTTPAFIKSLPVDHALSDEVLVAYAMNGADLPLLNGYPLRLVVPGYFGTYWVKHLSDIQVRKQDFDGFFMAKGYRIPANDCACVEPGATPKATTPIGRMPIRSFITSIDDGASLRAGVPLDVHGIAFDSGQGIAAVALSKDGGASWTNARLGTDLGPYSFRSFAATITLAKPGSYELLARATSRSGETQPMAPRWNPSGYQRNVVERVKVVAL